MITKLDVIFLLAIVLIAFGVFLSFGLGWSLLSAGALLFFVGLLVSAGQFRSGDA